MTRIRRTVEIASSPETVWSIAADAAYTTKVFPDLISYDADPPGLATVGQKRHGIFKIAGRKVDTFAEITEAEQNKKWVARSTPGGLFKSLTTTMTLEPTKEGTRANWTLEYEVSKGYLGKILSKLVVDRMVTRNANVALKNLKELAELNEMPKTT